MKTPAKIRKQLERLVGASMGAYCNDTTYEEVLNELEKEIDTTCKVINHYFAKEPELYVIVWTGRDCESGVWDEYPCFQYGYFTSKLEALQRATDLNNEEPGEYDEDAEEESAYGVKTILPAKTED